MTARDVLREIAADMRADAHAFYRQPFSGRTVGEALGNLGAAVAALADVVASLLPLEPVPEPERDPVPYVDYLPEDMGERPEVLLAPSPAIEDPGETITVCVRDRSREAPWGVGLTSPVTRRVTISALCPKCGGPRGERRWSNQCDDGAFYGTEIWDNPCGHQDMYEDVVKEAARLADLGEINAEAARYLPELGEDDSHVRVCPRCLGDCECAS